MASDPFSAAPPVTVDPSNPPVTHEPAPSGPDPAIGAVLAPRYWVSAGVVLLGIAALLALKPLWSGALWLASAVALFGLVLALQTALLRLQFAPAELLVWRGSTCIRRFPYAAWLGWKLFWPAVPVLFYFREQRSIHLLPLLFDAATLRQQLEQHVSPPTAPERPDSTSDL